MNPEHTCPLAYNNKQVTAKWCGSKYQQKWVNQPDWNINSFASQVRNDTQSDVSRWTFYRAKRYAYEAICGDSKIQYGLLWDYCNELKRTNPGTTTKIKTRLVGDEVVFERLYICFGALKKGFKDGCRPIIGLDGCHLKGHQKGQILTSVGIDANNGMYPIAFSIVESECKDSWVWFLEHLRADLNLPNNSNITWISDKQKGLEQALHHHFSRPEHRNCVRHLYNNFKSQHKGAHLKFIMWGAARATTEYGYVEINLQLLIEAKRVEGSKWKNGVGPRIWKILQKTQAIAIQHYVSFHGDSSFEIKTSGGDQYVVDLSKNYCACRKWQLCGLPCSHAMAGIMNRGLNPIE
ncbi:hypothetical protein UlMin_038347 [Ulmus minor]